MDRSNHLMFGVLTLLLVALLVMESRQSQALHAEREAAHAWQEDMSKRMAELELEVKKNRLTVEQMQEQSMAGMMRNANNTVAKGWMTMLDTFDTLGREMGREMERASESLARELEKLEEDQ